LELLFLREMSIHDLEGTFEVILKFQEPYPLEKAFVRILTPHFDDLAKSKNQADFEGSYTVF